MSIPIVSDITAKAPLPLVPSVAPVAPAAATGSGGETTGGVAVAVQPAPAAVQAPPPPPPDAGLDVEVGHHDGADAETYVFVAAESGEDVVQFPAEQVLSRVASILRRLEEEGLR